MLDGRAVGRLQAVAGRVGTGDGDHVRRIERRSRVGAVVGEPVRHRLVGGLEVRARRGDDGLRLRLGDGRRGRALGLHLHGEEHAADDERDEEERQSDGAAHSGTIGIGRPPLEADR